jgi:fucose permease
LKIVNVGVLLAGSSGLVALSAFNYSTASNWPFFAIGSLLHGLGSGAIDAGLNHYVASHFAARHMNWLHACYSVGAMLGPMLMTGMITELGSWRWGYSVVAATLLALSLLFMVTKERWDDSAQAAASNAATTGDGKEITVPAALRNPIVWLHIVLFFIYTGLEVSLGQWSYTVLTESRNIAPKLAGSWVTIYWGSILIGRIVVGFLVDRVGIDRLVRISTITAFIGSALFAWNPSVQIAPLALGLAGFGLAVIFPCLMSRTPQRVGKEIAAHAIGFQVGGAMLGAAVLPSAAGTVAQQLGLHYVPVTILVMAGILFLLHEAVLAVAPRSNS